MLFLDLLGLIFSSLLWASSGLAGGDIVSLLSGVEENFRRLRMVMLLSKFCIVRYLSIYLGNIYLCRQYLFILAISIYLGNIYADLMSTVLGVVEPLCL